MSLPNTPAGRRFLRSLLVTVLALVMLVGCLGGLATTLFFDLLNNYGVVYSPDLPTLPYTSPADLKGANPLGVNTALHLETDSAQIDRILDMVKAGGFGFIRQNFPWEALEPTRGQFEWAKFDEIVAKAELRQLQIIARLDRPPFWARPKEFDRLKEARPKDFSTLTGPPENYEDYANFVAEVARHYQGKLKFYQLWNEPNLSNEWNDRKVNATEYVNLLKVAYTRLKQIDPTAVVLAAPLAATDQSGPQFNNLNELTYLDEMYRAGAKAYFDILTVMIYGLGYSPDYRFLQPDFRYNDFKRINLNRAAASREVMVKYGDKAKSVWAMEYGWVAIPPGPYLNDYLNPQKWNQQWGQNISEEEQGNYLVGGLERARKEWPWLGVVSVWFFRADPPLAARPTDPTNYFALVQPDFQPRPAYLKLQAYARQAYKTAGTGWHPAADPALTSSSGQLGAISAGDKLNLSFEGERAELVMTATRDGTLKVATDGGTPKNLTFKAGGETRLTLADGLNYGPHKVEITFEGATGLSLAQVTGFYISRDNHLGWLVLVLYAGLGLGTAGSGGVVVWQTGRGIGWLVPQLGKLVRHIWRNRTRYAPYGMILALAIYYFAPSLPIAVAGALFFFPMALLRPDWAVFWAVVFAPLYLHPRDLRLSQSPLETLLDLTQPRDQQDTRARLEFTLTEVILVMATAAWFIRAIFELGQQLFIQQKSKIQNPFTLPLTLFFLVACFSLLVPEPSHLKEALREFRLVLLEPLLLYLLALRFVKGRAGVWRIFDGLIGVGVAVALLGIWQFFFGRDRIVSAEGVSRVVSVYNHPDNLGLFLGRVIPLATGYVFFFGQKWNLRRWFYLIALIPLVAALALSFSRGAWLGSGLALLVMILVAGSKRGLLIYGGGVALLLATLPFIKIERITSLFSFVTGSNSTRLHVWQASLQMLRDHPLTGIGLDQFLYKYSVEYVPPEAWLERFTSHPHNLILDYWLRLGIMGVALILWLLITFYKRLFGLNLSGKPKSASQVEETAQNQAKNENSPRERRVLGLGLVGSMADFLGHGLVDNSYFLVDLAIIFCLSLALVEALKSEALAEKEKKQ
ncbi:MAG: O-antigen ligase family protein [Chloroflexi bacterium]|nr:O-antigen ligase family protein [Chloroflexota bacterium]